MVVRQRANLVLFLALVASFLLSQEISDPFDRALKQIGLSKETARFDLLDMNNFGGSEFQVNFFHVLHQNPFKVPTYADAIKKQLTVNAKSLSALATLASVRLDETVRRGLIDDPIEDIQKNSKQPNALVKAIVLIHKKNGEPLDENQLALLKEKLRDVPQSVAEATALILYETVRAYSWRQRAFSKLPRNQDLKQLFQSLPSEFDDIPVNLDLLDAIRSIDLKSLFAGAQDLLMAIEIALKSLRKERISEKFSFRHETPIGWIEISNASDDFYPKGIPRLLTIDLSGDDIYKDGGATIDSDNPISILIDTNGNDIYHSDNKNRSSFGAGVLGYGILLDLNGNDSYKGWEFSQGCGVFGIGYLMDEKGNDTYIAQINSQGSASFGAGILVDLDGNDRYEAFSEGQGFGYVKGCGFLIDLDGDDEYIAKDNPIVYPSPQTNQHNTSLSQGCGYGRRADYSDGHSFSGGVGILMDAKGNDKYSAGVFGQGTGYWYGVGILIDDNGNDTYDGVWYVQGNSAHFAVGILVDNSGDDKYQASMNMAQGAGHDFSMGFLIDRNGNDYYTSPNLSLGVGNANGIGIFWDMTGDDVYNTKGGITLGQASVGGVIGTLRDNFLTLGIFIDSKGKDSYPDEFSFAGNNKLWTQLGANQLKSEKGVGLDEE